MSKVLITGASGYLGFNLLNFLSTHGFDTVGLDIRNPYNLEQIHLVDITDQSSLDELIHRVCPDILIHTAGIKNIELCEKEPDLTFRTNIEATTNIINSLVKSSPQTKLIFISSDYVFDGVRGNYTESDTPNPTTVYGKSKLAAEQQITDSSINHLIIRTSNLFGKGGGFYGFVKQAIEHNEKLEAYSDTYFTPTYIDYFMHTIIRAIKLNTNGLLHISGSQRVNRYQFARLIAAIYGKEQLITHSIQPPMGFLAKDSSLDSALAAKTLKSYLPDIETAIYVDHGFITFPYFSHIDERGSILGSSNEQQWEEINFITSMKGSVRGGHYHKSCMEGILITEGIVAIVFRDTRSKQVYTFTAKKGSLINIQPYVEHTFTALTDVSWVNMLTRKFDQEFPDIYSFVE